MEFYGIVVAVASVFLILCLILVGILMQSMNPDVSFPPVTNSCPDNWVIQGNTCAIPTERNIGIVKESINHKSFIDNTPGITNPVQKPTFSNPLDGKSYVDFSADGWKVNGGGSAICGQQKWTNQYGITWDGVSNATGCS